MKIFHMTLELMYVYVIGHIHHVIQELDMGIINIGHVMVTQHSPTATQITKYLVVTIRKDYSTLATLCTKDIAITIKMKNYSILATMKNIIKNYSTITTLATRDLVVTIKDPIKNNIELETIPTARELLINIGRNIDVCLETVI